MLKTIFRTATAAVFAVSAHMAVADGHATSSWTLDAGASKLAFGSIKKDTVGEVHSFEGLSGTVTAQGVVTIDIDLASVETNIDIRNERMGAHVFKGATTATLSAQVDMADLSSMAVGASEVVDVETVLGFLGQEIELDAELFALRVSETQVMITTNDMIFVGTEDLGVTAGIDKLMELAKLPGITRTTPVTLRLMFNMDDKKAEVAPAAPATTQVALAGDVKAGKKVFKKCKACHQVKEGKNGVGPTLYNIVGAPAGQVDGFKYSDAMANSGLVWDVETLSAFLAKPRSVVKGSRMAFNGLKKEADIENVIAYIMDESKG